MADDGGYHSPQFSEEAAWLPPWLQQPQLQISVDGHVKDDRCLHPFGRERNVSGGEGTNEGSNFGNCHLILSGGENSSIFDAHSSGNVPLFHLHLSSEGISQISSGELNNAYEIGAFEVNRQSVPQFSVIQNKMDNGDNMENEHHRVDIPPGGCVLRILQRSFSELPTGDNQNNGKKNQEKLDGCLETIDIGDAVELTIAASEALVISELITSCSHSESVNTAAVLEVALRVKQARTDSDVHDSEAISSSPTDEHDETDQLHGLDDYIMADAFEDVGVPFDQIVTIPNVSLHGKVSATKIHTENCNSKQGQFPCSDNLYVLNTPLPEGRGYGVALDIGPKGQDPDLNTTALQEKLSHASPAGLTIKQLPLQALSFNCMEPSINCAVNLDTSNMKNQVKEPRTSLQADGDGSSSANIVSKGCRNIQDGEDILHRDKKFRGKIPKLFHRETSFISESMDVPADGNGMVRTPEADSKTIASSSSLFKDLHRVQYERNTLNIIEEMVASCNSLEIDTLCSVVPCSLSSDYTHVSHGDNQEAMGMEAQYCLEPAAELVGLQNPEESVPFMAGSQRGNLVSSKLRDEGSMVIRNQLNSLKNHSARVPAKDSQPGNTFLAKESILAKSTTESKYSDRYSREEDNPRTLLKLTTKSQNVNEQTQRGKIYSQVCRPLATEEGLSALREQILKRKESLDNDTSPNVHQNADFFAPIILNTGTWRRLRACNVTSPGTFEHENPKISLWSKMEKNETTNPKDEVHCRNQASCSNLCTHFIEEQNLPRKKVCFSESKADVHHLPANLSEEQTLAKKKLGFSDAEAAMDEKNTAREMNSGSRTSCYARTNRKIKDSTNPSKSGTRKSNYKYWVNGFRKDGKKQILKGLEFLLTGFLKKKKVEIETLIRRHGGLVLPDISSSYLSMDFSDRHLPIVLSPKKVRTTKFLYGCTIKTWLLHDDWLADSVLAGFMLPPVKYLTLPNQISERKYLKIGELHRCSSGPSGTIFDKLGVMLFGKTRFYAKFSKIIKFGGGRVFKTLQWLIESLKNGKNTVGAIIVEDEINVSRHLKHCALEHDLFTMPASWITNSLFSGKLLPCKKDRTAPLHRIKKPRFPADPIDVSEEI